MKSSQQLSQWQQLASLELFYLKEIKNLLEKYPVMSKEDTLVYVDNYIKTSETKIDGLYNPSREQVTGLPAISESAEGKMSLTINK